MRAYGKLESGFWQNQKVRKLTDAAKLLLTYIYSTPHGNSVGCFVLPDGYIMADMNWPSELVSKHVLELVAEGFIERDAPTNLLRIVGWFDHNTIENDNVAKAAVKTIRSLPVCAVSIALFKDLNTISNRFLNPYLNELRNVFGNGFLNPEPKPEPEPEPKPSSSPMPAAPPPPDSRVLVIRAFDEARVEVFGEEARRAFPDATDAVYAQRFLATCPDPAWLKSFFLERMSGMKRDGGKTPKSLRYFEEAVPEGYARFLAAKDAPLPKPGTRGASASSEFKPSHAGKTRSDVIAQTLKGNEALQKFQQGKPA